MGGAGVVLAVSGSFFTNFLLFPKANARLAKSPTVAFGHKARAVVICSADGRVAEMEELSTYMVTVGVEVVL